MVMDMGKLLAEITARFPEKDRLVVERAFGFAQKAHRGQKRKSQEEYIYHPLRVAGTLSRLGLEYETICAAILHDVLEDTKITAGNIKKEFNDNIAFLIEGVSKLKSVDFRGGSAVKGVRQNEQRRIESFRKMILATAKDIRVVLIKLADVLDNIQTIEALSKEKQLRYAREVLEIYAPIAERLGIGWLKGELEDFAFPYVFPDEYQELFGKVEQLLKENKLYIQKLEPKVLKLLAQEGIRPLRVDARTKHLYSLWKKMNRYQVDASKIYDLVAFRIIVKDIPACYAVLGTIHKHWTPLPGRINDYIALPKPNGYQSLHTKVFCEGGKVTEFQIRTEKIHQEAEFGIAAHWAYKEKVARPFKKNLTWIQQLQDWHKAVDSKEFLKSLKIDFFHDRIFVFTPKGEVIDLPEGATPVDFAYAIHSDLGDKCILAKVNGKPAQLSSSLKNNDLVEIVTAKNKRPSPDWIGFVKTSKARSKIRDTLRKKD